MTTTGTQPVAWQKTGLVYAPAGDRTWARSYAHLPTADVLEGARIRVYIASLDEHRRGRIGYVDVAADRPSEPLAVSPDPVLDIGEPGTFDDSGVNPSCIVNTARGKHLFYIGWQRTERVPYMLFAGLAIAGDDGIFRKVSRTPILDRTTDEPFLRSATSVLIDNESFRAWYVSATGWTTVDGAPYPEYVIRYAESDDGMHWRAYRHICIGLEDASEFGIGRPWVVRDGDLYRMWYSVRSRTAPYRIGYAESQDGLSWRRMDTRAGIVRSETGWDSEMICYPCVVRAEERWHMFYNGNRHGATGFGHAELTRDAL